MIEEQVEWLWIWHPNVDDPQRVTRTAYDEVWSDKGWIAGKTDPDTGRPVRPDETPGEDVSVPGSTVPEREDVPNSSGGKETNQETTHPDAAPSEVPATTQE